jgi:amino acid adenylation domain-containing protein
MPTDQTAASYPQDLTLPELFAAQVARTPDAVALVCGAEALTFSQLDAASSRLAHELLERGAAPATRIAVILERSPDLLVALLAVLKAGSAYIPLDPAYPPGRLEHIFANSKPAAVITRESLVPAMPPGGVPLIRLDADGAAIASQSSATPTPGPAPGDLAYVIYTSGSTGRPKGVQIRHRALVNLLWALRSQPGMTGRDVLVAVTTVSFDMSVPELFLPLLVGARIVLAGEEEVRSGDALLGLIRRSGATVMQATPVTWQMLLEAGWRGDPALRMWCGGEAMPRRLAESLLATGGELWNLYGPTETTVWSSVLRVESGAGPVPVGPPLANTRFYILGHHGELAPPGEAGELLIGGDGVAPGYFDLPEATQERFVADRFGPDPRAILYRTGDIVRRTPDAAGSYTLEFLGRADQQVKLRGFRIELGEIESVLLGHPGVAEAVAVLVQDPSGEGSLRAYVAPRRDHQVPPRDLVGELRHRLGQTLPAYMHPSSISVLGMLPRMPNGKLDRNSLPAPAMPVGERPTDAAFTGLEQLVAGIWSSVLGCPVQDITADFFEVGGNSLLAARLLARINAEFRQQMTLAMLFQAPTIAAQARLLVEDLPREYDFRQVVRLQASGSRPPLIAIHNTGVYFYRLSSRLGADQPLTALQLFDPSVTSEAPPTQLEDIAAGYVRLIFKVHPAGPYQLIGWCIGGVLAFEVGRQLTALGHEVSFLALIDAWAPGHLRRMSRLRAVLADYSFRWQLIAADWRRAAAGRQGLADFLGNRTLIRRLMRRLGYARAEPAAPVPFEARGQSPESYDQWLVGYLADAEDRYEPGPYAGNITLLRSALEPHGPFLEPGMGWATLTTGTVDVVVMAGDHFTVFQGQGLGQMAGKVTTALAAASPT